MTPINSASMDNYSNHGVFKLMLKLTSYLYNASELTRQGLHVNESLALQCPEHPLTKTKKEHVSHLTLS